MRARPHVVLYTSHNSACVASAPQSALWMTVASQAGTIALVMFMASPAAGAYQSPMTLGMWANNGLLSAICCVYAVGQPDKGDPAVHAAVLASRVGAYYARGVAAVFPASEPGAGDDACGGLDGARLLD